MNEKSYVVMAVLFTIVFLGFFFMVFQYATKESTRNKQLITECIKEGKHPVVNNGSLLGCN